MDKKLSATIFYWNAAGKQFEKKISGTRQRQRNARLKEAANRAGFETIDKLAAAIIDGSVTVRQAHP